MQHRYHVLRANFSSSKCKLHFNFFLFCFNYYYLFFVFFFTEIDYKIMSLQESNNIKMSNRLNILSSLPFMKK